jgi:Protein of unknown function, DUF417
MKRRAINKDCGAQEFESIKKGANRRKFITNLLVRMGVLRDDLDYHLIRASMVIIFLFFGYQKWFEYEAQGLSTSLRLRHLQMPLKFFQERPIACFRSGSWQDTHRTEIPTATSGCRTGIFLVGGSAVSEGIYAKSLTGVSTNGIVLGTSITWCPSRRTPSTP